MDYRVYYLVIFQSLKLKMEDTPVIPVEETTLNRLKKAGLHRRGIWGIDFFNLPAIVRDKGERPYYPYISLLVDHNSAFILDFQLEKDADCENS
jgi:hypothetical protein